MNDLESQTGPLVLPFDRKPKPVAKMIVQYELNFNREQLVELPSGDFEKNPESMPVHIGIRMMQSGERATILHNGEVPVLLALVTMDKPENIIALKIHCIRNNEKVPEGCGLLGMECDPRGVMHYFWA